ncbi:unnamed protein product [Lactuca virosa]|uniref:Poly(A) RNA polymerase mitochondrial-like central palm domain-containing protein n=1 Tax=Lactuca virosa TaxID=75947 RepID=A0AAU9LDH7_9ASTR|nr:unnamed protein product [Lactuca virosa]
MCPLIGFRKSGIDVCLAIGNANIDKAEILLKLPDILKSDNLGNVHVILLKGKLVCLGIDSSQVPIVRLMDLTTGIRCDICVNNLLAAINTKLLRDYSKIDVIFRQLLKHPKNTV